MADQRITTETGSGPHGRRWQALALLGVAQFMLILDVTVVAIALPHIGADLDLSRSALTWVVSAYTLTFGGLMLLGGRGADLFGARGLVLGGLATFTAASLVVGLAGGAEVLIAGRVAQGLGAAMLSPAALSVVVRLFEGEERNKALGIWSALGGSGAAVGVLLGGVLTAGPGWPWAFFVNVPVGVAIMVLLPRMLPPLPRPEGARPRLDVPGALLVTGATGVGIYALINAGDHGWGAASTLGLAAVAVVLYLVFGAWQRAAKSPLMDLGLLFRRPVTAGTFVILTGTALMVAVFFLGSFYLQEYSGHGPLVTGLLFLPVALATMAGAHTAGRVIGGLGARRVGVTGMVIAAAGLVVPVLWAGTPAVVTGVALAAAGIGSLFVVASATALGQVEPHQAGLASGIVSTFHEFGASIGAAVVSSLAAVSLAGGTDTGFERAFTVSAVVAAVAAAVIATLIPADSARH
ncbi:MFS transporter [Streptomyces niveus]|uniref:MFS transporter n=1 Tax=Streptomyces niveus TaxID=193462 RepID=UPI0036DCBDD7